MCISEGDDVFLDLVSEVVAPVYGAVAIVLVSVEPGQVGGEREASVFTGNPDPVRDGVVLAMHHVVRHPAIESGEHLHTDRGFSVGAFPQVPAHVYVEPVGCGICKTGVAQAASTGCFDIGADGRIYPFFAFQDLEKELITISPLYLIGLSVSTAKRSSRVSGVILYFP